LKEIHIVYYVGKDYMVIKEDFVVISATIHIGEINTLEEREYSVFDE